MNTKRGEFVLLAIISITFLEPRKLLSNYLQMKRQKQMDFTTFEYLDVVAKSWLASFRLVTVHRSTPFQENGLKEGDFLDEFLKLLEQLCVTSKNILISGDFKFQVNKPSEIYPKKFLCLLKPFNLKQHICDSIHKNGNTLDLLITRFEDETVRDINNINSVYIVRALRSPLSIGLVQGSI